MLSSPRFREGTSKSTAWPQGMSTLSAVEGFNPGIRPVGQVLALLHRNQPEERNRGRLGENWGAKTG
jgi:hypothetical protein